MSRESLADIASRYGQYSTFGHKDYEMAKKAGYSDNDIKSYLDEDISRLHADNQSGGSAGLYDEILGKTVDLSKKVDIDRGPSASSMAKEKAEARVKAVPKEEEIDTEPIANNINFNPGGVDMGDDDDDDELIRSIAKERAQAFTNRDLSITNTITNDVEQNIGNKGDLITTIGDGNTITGSKIANNYSLSLGSMSLGNKIT